jgi:transcriptional regulator with XRE-family HTH domain
VEVDADKLKALREHNVLSQRELARLAGITHTTLWRLENGHREARPETIRKLAIVLEVEPHELLEKGKRDG